MGYLMEILINLTLNQKGSNDIEDQGQQTPFQYHLKDKITKDLFEVAYNDQITVVTITSIRVWIAIE